MELSCLHTWGIEAVEMKFFVLLSFPLYYSSFSPSTFLVGYYARDNSKSLFHPSKATIKSIRAFSMRFITNLSCVWKCSLKKWATLTDGTYLHVSKPCFRASSTCFSLASCRFNWLHPLLASEKFTFSSR